MLGTARPCCLQMQPRPRSSRSYGQVVHQVLTQCVIRAKGSPSFQQSCSLPFTSSILPYILWTNAERCMLQQREHVLCTAFRQVLLGKASPPKHARNTRTMPDLPSKHAKVISLQQLQARRHLSTATQTAETPCKSIANDSKLWETQPLGGR